MLVKEDLLSQKTAPNIRDVSLELYREFSEDILLKRRFHYYFKDGSDVVMEFREFGIYHMLAIQHIDNKIPNNRLLERIANGLSFSDFQKNDSVKKRFKGQKKRVTLFACVYHILKSGKVFYIKNSKVPNLENVSVDYIVKDGTVNIGIRYESGVFVPLTILISKSSDPDEYVEGEQAVQKEVTKLIISDIDTGHVIEEIIHKV
jgi:hypothetical protein